MNDFNFSEFVAMGGYAKYVWSSWALTVIAFACLIISALRKRKQVYRNFEKQQHLATVREQRVNKRKAELNS